MGRGVGAFFSGGAGVGRGVGRGCGWGVGGVGSGSGGVGSGGASTGAVSPSSSEGSSCGLSAGAAAISTSETIETGTEFTSGFISSFDDHDTKASATTPACRAMEPRMAGLGRRKVRQTSVGSSAAVSVIRFSLVKPEADRRAITRATA